MRNVSQLRELVKGGKTGTHSIIPSKHLSLIFNGSLVLQIPIPPSFVGTSDRWKKVLENPRRGFKAAWIHSLSQRDEWSKASKRDRIQKESRHDDDVGRSAKANIDEGELRLES